MKAFQKQDGASMLRFEICYGKAYGALALGRPSKLVLQKAREKPLFMQSLERLADYPLFLEGGGQLIRDKTGELLGAVGVTGDANELDDLCAIAGIHAAKLCADSDFFDDPDLMRALSIHKSAPLVDPRPALVHLLERVELVLAVEEGQESGDRQAQLQRFRAKANGRRNLRSARRTNCRARAG